MSNIQPYIILNGTDSRSISGLLISSLPPISKPQVRTQIETVDGRDGDIITPLGFSAYDKVINIGLTYNYDVDEIIEFFNSEGIVTFSNEPDKYYRYAIYEQIDFEKLIKFKTAEVTLHVQPFKFSTTEEPELFDVVSGQAIAVTNEGNTDSRPNLTIIGSGDIDVSLNGSQILSIELEDDQAVIIDSEDMNAYAAQSAIREVEADIEPIQDLNGYDSVWIGGAGKNLFNDTTGSHTINANTDDTLFIGDVYLEANTTYTISCKQTPAPLTSFVRNTLVVFGGGSSTYNPAGNDYTIKPMTFTPTVSGTYSVRIWGHTLSANTTYTDFQVEEGSTATAYEPYENICEINGSTELDVTLCGKNLFKTTATSKTESGITWTINSDGTITVSGTASGYSSLIAGSAKVKSELGNVTISGLNGTTNLVYNAFKLYDRNKNLITQITVGSGSNQTLNLSNYPSVAYLEIEYKRNNNVATSGTIKPQVNIGSQASDYVKYQGSDNIINISINQWNEQTRSGYYKTDGTFQSYSGNLANTTPVSVKPNTKYRFLVKDGSGAIGRVCWYDSSMTFISTQVPQQSNIELTSPDNAYYMNFDLTGAYGTTYNNDVSINYPATFTDYYPYTDIGTVYGGHLNVTTGELTIDRVLSRHTWGEFTSKTVLTNYTRGQLIVTDEGTGINTNPTDICNLAPFKANYSSDDCHFYVGVGGANTVIYVFLPNNASNDTIIQVCYKLADPITIQLTPTQINNLLGLNNMYTDNSGDLTVKHKSNGVIVTDTGDIVSFYVGLDDIEKGVLLNRAITGDYDKIRLRKGVNTFVLTGNAQQFAIDKYSRWI